MAICSALHKSILPIVHIRILMVVLETSMKERLLRGNHFKCKLFPPHEPPSHARSSPTVRIRIRSIAAAVSSIKIYPTSLSVALILEVSLYMT